MKISSLYLAIFFSLTFLTFSCNLQPQQQQEEVEAPSEEELKSQSDEFSKSMDELDEAMDVAVQLNERIQLVEQRFTNGEITRERADRLIDAINKRYGKDLESASETDLGYVFPAWLQGLNLSEPKGLSYDAANSYQTNESNAQDGYNSVLFVYHGSYSTAMKEADRIAQAAGIPMTETYRKARELSKKLGKNIAGVKGVTYMNYELGTQNFRKQYKISINVDEHGKFTLNVVDIKTKTEREKSGQSLPKGF